MHDRRNWRRAVIAALLALALAPTRAFGFVESTVTEGEIKTNLNGVWLVVSHLQFAKPTPTPSPGAAAAKPAKAAGKEPVRYYNVVNLVRIVHLPKPQAQAVRDADKKMEQASIDRAKAMIAEEQKKSIPVQTESGEVESEMKVVVPSVPLKRQPGDGDDVDMFLLDVAMPPEIDEPMQKAQKEEKPWTPARKDLALLKSSWSSLKPSGRDEISKIEWKVTAASKFDDQLQIDPTTKDAKFAITANQEMLPKPNVPKTNVLVFGARKISDDLIEGPHVRAMMASAPFPIPIEMKGSFKMYKVADLPKTGSEGAAEKPEAAKAKAE